MVKTNSHNIKEYSRNEVPAFPGIFVFWFRFWLALILRQVPTMCFILQDKLTSFLFRKTTSDISLLLDKSEICLEWLIGTYIISFCLPHALCLSTLYLSHSILFRMFWFFKHAMLSPTTGSLNRLLLACIIFLASLSLVYAHAFSCPSVSDLIPRRVFLDLLD